MAKHYLSRFRRYLALIVMLACSPAIAHAQTDAVSEARAAITAGEYARAAALLSATIAQQPSADAYVYLGVAYAHTREWKRAEDTLKEGLSKYPRDPRFHNELAGVYLAANDLDRARESLHSALGADPANKYASDLLATIEMSIGNVRSALSLWNEDGRPVAGNVLHNAHVEPENWVIPKAMAFRSGEKLTFSQWKTTEARLRETGIFSNVNVDIEPTVQSDRYTVVVRTSAKTNSTSNLAIPLLEALLFEHPTLNWWNVRNSAISLNAGYRFATNRHRAEAGVRIPIPVPGLLFFEGQGVFRSERWDISRPARDTGFDPRFRYQSTGFRMMVKHIPHYRVQFGGGFEYRNRTVSGSQPGLSLDSRNTGKMLVEASVLPVDGRYRSRIHAQVFAARPGFLGDMNYSGGTLEWNNSYEIPIERQIGVEVTLKGGRSRGALPVDDYFVLGLDESPENLLRGHNSFSSRGHYGRAPMATSFVLMNATVDRRMTRVPLFNILNVPQVVLKWQFFLDGAKAWDRAHVFEQGKILVDAGAGFKVETPTKAVNITYGRSLRDGTGAFAVYVQQRW